jgi:hypothetical protein
MVMMDFKGDSVKRLKKQTESRRKGKLIVILCKMSLDVVVENGEGKHGEAGTVRDAKMICWQKQGDRRAWRIESNVGHVQLHEN